MKVSLIIFLGLLSICFVSSEDVDLNEWENFKLKFGKVYESSIEEVQRMKIWKERKQAIDQHNDLFEKGKVSFNQEVNKFSDLTALEVEKLYMGLKLSRPSGDYEIQTVIKPLGPFPDELDWRTKGAVTEVKSQGKCGSDYAFSVVGTIEAQYYLKTGKLMSFSEQSVLDCSQRYGNFGCKAGFTESAYKFIMSHDGIQSEQDYPYKAEAETCQYDRNNVTASIFGYYKFTKGEGNLQHAVVYVGPMSVEILVPESLISYQGGIFSVSNCSDGAPHAALVVGYGSENGTDFWVVKNSWGKDWGENGYFRIARNRGNMCNISTLPTSAFGIEDKRKEERKIPVLAKKENLNRKSFLKRILSRFERD